MKYAFAAAFLAVPLVSAQQPLYAQCGGTGWTGATTCVSGSTCTVSSQYYSQCLPGAAAATTAPAPAASGTGTAASTRVRFGGVNIAGFDFGCGTDGTCNVTQAYPPLKALNGPDGAGQMQHFVKDDGFNIFRLPVGWQFLVKSQLGGTLDSTNAGKYDQLVQACLATGAHCIIDIHNYARWNGGIIGQGGPTNDQFVSLWSQLATKYASQANIIFGVMNEPHDVPNITTWAATVQAVVTAIRKAGATSQMILLPGNNWTSAQTFVSNGSGAALAAVTNLDGSTTNLIFDVHKYLDSDNSGTHSDCVTNNVADTFQPLATWLRQNNRQALNTETGGGNVQDCVTDLGAQLQFFNQNSDVFLGFVGWSAGSFDSTYVLTLTPTSNGGSWTDTMLVKQALVPNGPNAK